MTKYGLKSLSGGSADMPQSIMGRMNWKIGEWKRIHDRNIEPCQRGFHFFTGNGLLSWYDWGYRLAIVEVGNFVKSQERDSVWEKHVTNRMKIVKVLPDSSIVTVRKASYELGTETEDGLYTPMLTSSNSIYNYIMEKYATPEMRENNG